MNMLQGWKVKLYAFVTLFLFFAGVSYTMWPHANDTNANSAAVTTQIVAVRGAVQDQQQPVLAVGEIEPTVPVLNSAEGGVYMPEKTDVLVDDPVAVSPAPIDPAPTAQESVELPAIKHPLIIQCGCVALQKTDYRLCPKIKKDSALKKLSCKAEY